MLGLYIVVAVVMKTKLGFCCCKSVFDSEADYLLNLSCDGFCRREVDRVVREIAWMVLGSRRGWFLYEGAPWIYLTLR